MLDPCPWCKKTPMLLQDFEFDVATVKCCHAEVTCATEDVEELWNWREDEDSVGCGNERLSGCGDKDTRIELDAIDAGDTPVPF